MEEKTILNVIDNHPFLTGIVVLEILATITKLAVCVCSRGKTDIVTVNGGDVIDAGSNDFTEVTTEN